MPAAVWDWTHLGLLHSLRVGYLEACFDFAGVEGEAADEVEQAFVQAQMLRLGRRRLRSSRRGAPERLSEQLAAVFVGPGHGLGGIAVFHVRLQSKIRWISTS